MFRSRMISPMESAWMEPERGFFTETMGPFTVAFTLLYSKARSASGSKVQFSRMRFSQ